MADEADERELLFARVIARLITLRHAGALRHASGSARMEGLDPSREHVATLWRWALAVDGVQRLIREVFVPARVEPGRIHQRISSESRGRPRGAVQWPRTAQVALQRGQPSPLDFHCNLAERSVLAPENLLLIWTLEDALAHTHASFARVEDSMLSSADDRMLVRRFRGEAELALHMPWARRCRSVLEPLRASGRRAERELEQAVEARVRGRPSAAPAWARSLLELRRMHTAVPSEAELAELDAALLWNHLAWLELISLLRAELDLRHGEAADRLADARGHVLEPLEGSATWVLAADQPKLAWSSTGMPDWHDVRREAALACLELRHRERAIDRWLVFHRARESPPLDFIRHRSIEIVLCRLDPAAATPAGLAGEVTRWLRER